MKLLSAVALLVVALPVVAQRGSSRGGFSGHAVSSFHAGSAAHFSAAPRYASSYRAVAGPGYTSSALRYRRPYRSAYAVPGFYGAGYLSYDAGLGYDYGYGDAGYPGDGYAQPYPGDPQPYVGAQVAPPDQGQFGPAIPYPSAPPPVAAAPASEDAVTLVYKDGRPAEQVHNYALTRTTLFVFDQHRREIALNDLDLPATVKVNHAAGVEFQLPKPVRRD